MTAVKSNLLKIAFRRKRNNFDDIILYKTCFESSEKYCFSTGYIYVLSFLNQSTYKQVASLCFVLIIFFPN